MPFDDSPGEHREIDGEQREAIVSNVRERQGVTGYNVRYILGVALAAIVILFAIFLAYFITTMG